MSTILLLGAGKPSPSQGEAGFSPFTPDLISYWRAGPTWNFQDAGKTIPAGNGDLVYVVEDQSANDWDAVQAIVGSRGTLTDDGNGTWSILSDASDDSYRNLVAEGGAQPLTMYVRVHSHTAGGRFFDLFTANTVQFGYNIAIGNDYALYAGSTGCAVAMPRIGNTPGTFTGLLDGANSLIRLDGTQIATGDAGANTGGPGIDLLNVGAAGASFGGKMTAILIYNTAHSLSRMQEQEAWLNTL